MSYIILLKTGVGLFLGLFFGWMVQMQYENEANEDFVGMRYRPVFNTAILPVMIATMFVANTSIFGIETSYHISCSVLFSTFVMLMAYYSIIFLLMPAFRHHLSARACALIWFIPNVLYMLMQNLSYNVPANFIIYVSQKTAQILGFIWLAGFMGIMLWKIAVHYIFKAQVLKNSYPVTDEDALSVWKSEIERSGSKQKYLKLIFSPNISTPVSFPMLFGTRVVLPEVKYTQEELKLIFRHEIIHICRDDSSSKFFMVFCTAMCWFNPLVWYAMSKSAEDIELSCDETVLLNSDEATRKMYAELILSNAGDSRGFTTCLSASAQSMRYRLKSIVKPRKRHSGAMTIAVLITLLCVSIGTVAIASENGTGADILAKVCNDEEMQFDFITDYNDSFSRTLKCVDQKALLDYIGSIKTATISSGFDHEKSSREYMIFYNTLGNRIVVMLCDDSIKIQKLYTESKAVEYYVPDGIDWEYLDSIILRYPAMTFNTNLNSSKGHAALTKLVKVTGDAEEVLIDIIPEEYGAGIYGGTPPSSLEFDFTETPLRQCTITVENWDRTEKFMIIPDENNKIGVTVFPAHYTVCAEFGNKDNSVYKAEFTFDIGEA